jgi:glycosyltransferase involved in cell wall biosynthesis
MNNKPDTVGTDKLVSVVMCTYNGSKYVRQQLDSICNQSYRNLEIIICDDCSVDDTFSVLEEYSMSDNRIKLYLNESNKGYVKNFSDACLYAAGSHIAISDQDDLWHLDKIKIMMQQWPAELPLVYCNSVRFTDVVPVNAQSNKKYRRFEGTDSRKLSIFNTISGHAMMVTKEFLNQALPFPQKLSYDWYSGVLAANFGGVGYIDEILVYQRVHGSNITVGGMYHNQRKFKHQFNQLVLDHIEEFARIKMPQEHHAFYQKLLALWASAIHKKFSKDLFLFLVKNRKVIFNYKRRKFGLISHIKHSYRLASTNVN